MTTVTITIDGFAVSVSHPGEELNLDAVVNLIHHALAGHRFTPEQVDERLNYDEMALPHTIDVVS